MAADSDKARAAEIREKIAELLGPPMAYLDELLAEGFQAGWAMTNDPKTNRMVITEITVTKVVRL